MHGESELVTTMLQHYNMYVYDSGGKVLNTWIFEKGKAKKSQGSNPLKRYYYIPRVGLELITFSDLA